MTLPWQESFELGFTPMDATHREFVDLLNQVDTVKSESFIDYFDTLLKHTQEHFEAEKKLMEESKFLSLREHVDDHNRILAEMMQMQRFAARGMTKIVRSYIKEKLPDWFTVHAASMDIALVKHLNK